MFTKIKHPKLGTWVPKEAFMVLGKASTLTALNQELKAWVSNGGSLASLPGKMFE
jgi:hypothetical protein